MILAEKLAFDTSLYEKVPKHIRPRVIAEDLAGFIMEAGAIDFVQRINPRELTIVNGQVFDPVRLEFINERWIGGNDLANRESLGADRFYSQLVKGKVVIAISPPGGISPYKETRINIAHLTQSGKIHLYGIPSNFTPEDCLQLAWRLNRFPSGEFNPQSPDDLRALPISLNIPPNTEVWDFLNQTARLDSNAWTDIKSGNPWVRKQNALAKAKETVTETESMINSARTYYDHIEAGARMEVKIQQKTGWTIDKWGCPGALNNELLFENQLAKFELVYTTDTFGNLRLSEGKFVKNCGNCGKEINSYIPKGYQCTCGGIYQGC